jgi:hypothetical protein
MCLPPPLQAAPVQVPPQDLGKVGGRLQSFSRRWRHVGTNEIRRWVKEGVKLEFTSEPPATPQRPHDSASSISDPVRWHATDATVQKYHALGVLMTVPLNEVGKGLYMTFFPVEKKEPGAWRGCLDARPLNESILHQHFKMEGIDTVRHLIRRNDYMSTIDITEAYPHLAIHPDHRQYLRFVWNGVHYQYKALCFGLSSAPRLFTKLLRPVVQVLRAAGIRCVPYLDDVLILAPTLETCRAQTQQAINLLSHLGFIISSKSQLTPSRQRVFLGMLVDSHNMELRVPKDKLKKFLSVVRQTLRRHDTSSLNLRQLAGVIGKIQALAPAVTPARLLSRHLLFCKNRTLKLHNARPSAWNAPVQLTEAALGELHQWQTILQTWNGRAIIPPKARRTVTTDASHFGWGGWMQSKETRGFWTRAEARRSSNARELHTTVLVCMAFRKDLAGSVVEIRTDNMTTMAYLNHQGGRHPELTAIVRPLWEWALRTRTTIFATYLPGKKNDRADRLSRVRRDRTDWMLNKSIFRRIQRLFGPFTVDLFATRLNALLPRYVSRHPDPGAIAADAFTMDLRNENGYANPPFNLIGRLLAMVKRQRATLTIVLPAWEAQPWWPLLAEMLVQPPVLLPRRLDTFLPGHLGNELPMGPPRWSAIAVKVSGAPSSISAFHNRWRAHCLRNGVPKPPKATAVHGTTGTIFVKNVGIIPFGSLPS